MQPARFARRTAAVCLLAFAIPLAGCGSEQTGLGLDLISDEQIEQMGLEAWQQIRTDSPASGNAQYQQTADRIADRVLTAAGMDPSAWEIVVFQGDEVNAFALPGNKIGIFEGMMRAVKNEDQLATVIGHEIAHNEEGHSAERANSQAATQLGINVAGMALGVAGVGNPQAVAGLLGAGAQYGVILPYSRNQELEADRLGLQHMARAGYDPRQAVEFWQSTMQGGGGPPAFLSTHPAPQQRIQQLEALMPEAMEIYQANAR